MNDVVILAGGKGTRLQTVVADLPKPMAPVKGRPFLTYILDYLVDFGYKRVVLSVGYMYEKIEDYFGKKYKSLELDYALETEPLGTGGGMFFALSKCKTDNVLILNGDTIFKADLQKFEDFHRKKNSNLSIVLRKVDDTSRYGSVIADEQGKIIKFIEKQQSSGKGTINGGIYLINKSLQNKFNLPQKFSFEKDLMEKYYQNENFYAFESDGYFIDIGIPKDYQKAQIEL